MPHIRNTRLPRPVVSVMLIGLASLLAQGCSQNSKPQSFATPEQAVGALTDALRADDMQKVLAITGKDGKDIIDSGDATADSQRRQRFLAMYDQKHALVDEGAEKKTLVIGESDWPFPIPVVRDSDGWYFDIESGREEILNRRIGENELSAIQVCRAIADAQREYAMGDLDRNGIQDYAQQFASDEGKRNGLYYPTSEGEAPSPLGEFAASAAEEGYRRNKEGLTPYHGYYYRILKAQGPSAPGGKLDYVFNGSMSLGFAVVAWPAEYGNSGIMTFIMGHDGVVYQRDLGDGTAKIAGSMSAFDPGEGWKKAD